MYSYCSSHLDVYLAEEKPEKSNYSRYTFNFSVFLSLFLFDFSRIFRNETNDWDALQQNLFVLLMCAVVSLREHHWNLLTVNLRLLKALLNRFNISSNITKMLCWMKCCIGLTELKNGKKRKTYVWWSKIMFDENLIARKLFFQHFQPHPTQFLCWTGLLLVSCSISFLWRHFEC